MNTKLYYKTALKSLKNKSAYLVYFSPFNGEIRTVDGEVLGCVSSRVMVNLLNSDLFIHIGNGTDLLNHEKYYKLKELI